MRADSGSKMLAATVQVGRDNTWRNRSRACDIRCPPLPPQLTVERRMAPPPAAAHLHVTVADHPASQPGGPWHRYDASYRIMTVTGMQHQGHEPTVKPRPHRQPSGAHQE